ncbi:alpha/beta hydrolase [Deinococcus aestuarii]|uniref:alpha/beta hydrolase n=1 Tax=Deinococcus aestuarii TaxID=2774531 RepID=UPI001C0D7BE7|nr:alpha/beta fold hydrolase [Deinococcus aestuarii]
MRHLVLAALLTLSVSLAAPVQLRAPDGLMLYGESVSPARPRGVVLLLHAAGQNLHEFDGIAPRFAREGYASLALDGRFGGEYDGRHNRTVAGLGDRTLTGTDALADLGVALAWLRERHPGLPVFALGGGQSGALLFVLAARHPDLAGILAFSPNRGDLFDLDALAEARRVRVPVFVTSGDEPFEIAAARDLLAAAGSSRRVRYVPPGFGLRGVANLDPAKTTEKAVTEGYWAAVLRFLRGS